MIPNGNFVRAKWTYYKNKFKTKEGLFDFFVGTAIYGFIIVQFNQILFNFFLSTFSSLHPIFQKYLAYLFFGIVVSVAGIFITVLINKLYEFLLKTLKSIK